jgi:phosphatidate cytidylyltransferase
MAGNFAHRLAFSAVAIPTAAALIYLGGWPLALLLALAGCLGAKEVYDFGARLEVEALRRTGMVAATVVPLATYWAKGSEVHFAEPAIYVGALWLVALVALAAWRRGPTRKPLAAVALTLFGALYAGGLPAFAIVLRHPAGVGPSSFQGAALLLFPLVLTWAGDTAAYAGGTAIGGPKLAPTLSPRKTWAGAIAGLACTLLVALA